MERMMASILAISESSISAFFSSFGTPGSIPMRFCSGPIFFTCCICSRKSSRVNSPFCSLAAALAASSWSNASSAFSMRVSTSPIPRIREAMRSG